MTSSPNSLIMGVAAGYTNNLILPFLKSLRATSYAGKVCLLVGGISEDAITELRTLADDVVVLDGIYGGEIDKHRLRAYRPMACESESDTAGTAPLPESVSSRFASCEKRPTQKATA